MNALLDLEPRDAGTQIMEPTVEFTDSRNDLHDRVRCQYSAICSTTSWSCVGTQ